MQDITEKNVKDIKSKTTPLIYKILIILCMMLIMGGTLTGVMTYLNIGYSDTFISVWLRSFLTAEITVIPIGFALMMIISKLIEKLLPNTHEKNRNIIGGIIMACIMESGMAFTTTMSAIGFVNKEAFISGWLEGVIGALPFGLGMMLIVSTTVKPRIDKILKS